MTHFTHKLWGMGPDFLLAWVGWMMHSMVHSVGHLFNKAFRQVVSKFRNHSEIPEQ